MLFDLYKPVVKTKGKGIWSQRLNAELDASYAEEDRLTKFFREQPSASAFSMQVFPNIGFLSEMAQLEENGVAGYIESMALGDDE